MPSSSTVTLASTIEWSKRLNNRRPIALGQYLEPALTNANIILQTMVGPPFVWRWNRVITGFITTPGQQDYFLFNWTMGFTLSLGSVTVDPYGNSQSVTTAGVTGPTPPTWNNTIGGITADGTVQWTNLGPISVPVSQSYSFGWIENSSVLGISNASPRWFEMESKICLGLDSSTASSRPKSISAQGDDGNGNITFRMLPVPDSAYPVAITIQQKPPKFTSLNQTWSPVPDEYSRIYNWGFLVLSYFFSDDPRVAMANQKFVSSLLAVNEGLTETERNIFLANWNFISGVPVENINRVSQADQMRGV